MIIDIINDYTIEVYGETAELADKNAKKFIKIAMGNERWFSYSSRCGTVMDKAKLYKVIINLTKEAKQCNTAIVSGSYYWVKLMTDDKHEPAIAINLRGVMNFQFYNGVAVPCDQVNDYSECNYR